MPEKQINELTKNAEAISGTNIFHTQDSGNVDVYSTIQEIVDLIPVPTSTSDPGALAGAINVNTDHIVIADQSSSFVRARAPLLDLIALLDTSAVAVTGLMAVDGYLNLAGPTFTFQIRWGTVNSTTSAEQNFPFSTSFTNNCFGVVGNWKDANQNNGFWVKDWDKDGFNIDRWDGESGTKVYTYLAWGS